jgi:hypothetical protein
VAVVDLEELVLLRQQEVLVALEALVFSPLLQFLVQLLSQLGLAVQPFLPVMSMATQEEILVLEG